MCLVVYVMAGMWGIGDGIWQTQINALYGVLFYSQEEAAFSNYRLWESFGFIIAFITQASFKYGKKYAMDRSRIYP